jgi:hypothetical protein
MQVTRATYLIQLGVARIAATAIIMKITGLSIVWPGTTLPKRVLL